MDTVLKSEPHFPHCKLELTMRLFGTAIASYKVPTPGLSRLEECDVEYCFPTS